MILEAWHPAPRRGGTGRIDEAGMEGAAEIEPVTPGVRRQELDFVTRRIASPIASIAAAPKTAVLCRSVNIAQLRVRDRASKRPCSE